MEKLQYVIEDKTIAELLGVQNFSTDESAVLELVKNAYDAKASYVKLVFEGGVLKVIDDGIGMSLLDKILYIADYIEPGRDAADNLALIRKMAFEDIDVCLKKILEDTLIYLNSTGKPVDDKTEITAAYYGLCVTDKE